MNTFNSLFSLEGKVIVVTGGTGVLGKSFVEAVVDAGGIAVLIGQNKEVGTQRAEELVGLGGKALFIKANVLEEAELEAARDEILAAFGRIDGLVNAAGGNVPEGVVEPGADVFDLNIEGLKRAMVLNVWGTIMPSQVFGAVMAKGGGGSIVNISSVSPKRALTRVLGYSMGKAAIDCYNQWFAVEVARRYGDTVRINALMPGFFLTTQNKTLLTNGDGSLTERGQAILQHTPFNRFGHPDDLKGALVYLLSDASRFVTGTQIDVDGGFSVFSGV